MQIILLLFSPVVFGAGQAKSSAKKPAMDPVVVTVNGVAIMQSDLSDEIKSQLKMMRAPTDILTAEMRFEMRRKAIDILIERRVVSDWIAFKKITVKDEEIYKRMEELARQEGVNVDGLLSMAMVRKGLGPEEYKKRLGLEMCFDKLIEKEATKKDFTQN
jgi:FKBP-type peptidyl-prolyl cis-trans isomerase (trigger factor)